MNETVNTVVRPVGWQDAPISMLIATPEAMAIKAIGLRWNHRKLENIGFCAMAVLAGKSPDTCALIRITPRQILVLQTFASAEMAAPDAEFWMGKLKTGLNDLMSEIEAIRAILVF